MLFRGLDTRTTLDSLEALPKVAGLALLGKPPFVRSPFPFCAGFYATLNRSVARPQRAET